jgi:hypothetical protein
MDKKDNKIQIDKTLIENIKEIIKTDYTFSLKATYKGIRKRIFKI